MENQHKDLEKVKEEMHQVKLETRKHEAYQGSYPQIDQKDLRKGV